MKKLFSWFVLVCLIGGIGGCTSADKIISVLTDITIDAREQCEKKGGHLVITMNKITCERNITPEPDDPKPDDPKPDDPKPDDPKPDDPKPDDPKPDDPANGITYKYGEYYSFPYIDGPVNSGKIMFAMAGIDSNHFPRGDYNDGFLFMLMSNERKAGGYNGEYNLQLQIWHDGKHASMRLITQRFDKTCAPKSRCEVSDGINAVKFDPTKKYDVVIQWPYFSEVRGYNVFRMDIKDSNNVSIGVWEIPFYGGFNTVDWIRIGNGVYPGKAGLTSPLTIINPKMELN